MAEGEVRIKISAQDVATNAINSVGKALKTMVASLAGIELARRSFSAFFDTIQNFADYTAEIDKMNKITGMSTDSIQRLAYAAEQEHASIGQVSVAMRFLVRQMQNVRDGSKEAMAVFERLGVDVFDATGKNLRNVEDVFFDVSDAIRNTTNDTDRMSYALDLFGRSGTEILPFITMSSDEMKRLGDEAARVGKVLKMETIIAGEKFGDELERIKADLEGVKLAVAEDLLPMLEAITPHIKNLTEIYKSVAGVYEPILNWLADLYERTKPLAEQQKDFVADAWEQVELLKRALKGLTDDTDDTGKAAAAAARKLREWLNEVKPLTEWLNTLSDGTETTRAQFLAILQRLKELQVATPPVSQAIASLNENIEESATETSAAIKELLALLPGVYDVSGDLAKNFSKSFDTIKITIQDFGREFVAQVIENLIWAQGEATSLRDILLDLFRTLFSTMLRLALAQILPGVPGSAVAGGGATTAPMNAVIPRAPTNNFNFSIALGQGVAQQQASQFLAIVEQNLPSMIQRAERRRLL